MGMQVSFSATMEGHINGSTRTQWPAVMCDNWIYLRLALLGVLIELFASVTVALYTKNAGLAGLALVYASQMTSVPVCSHASLSALSNYTCA